MGSQSWSSDSNTIMDMMEKEEMKEIFRIQEEVYKRGMATLDHYSAMAMEQRMEMYVLVLVAFCLFILFKILNVNNSPEKSMFYCSNQKFLEEFLKKAPELTEPYIPTRFWGYSGHLQTIIQGVISRLHCPLVNGHRVSLKLTDGATVTYDLYHAIEAHPNSAEGDFTLCHGVQVQPPEPLPLQHETHGLVGVVALAHGDTRHDIDGFDPRLPKVLGDHVAAHGEPDTDDVGGGEPPDHVLHHGGVVRGVAADEDPGAGDGDRGQGPDVVEDTDTVAVQLGVVDHSSDIDRLAVVANARTDAEGEVPLGAVGVGLDGVVEVVGHGGSVRQLERHAVTVNQRTVEAGDDALSYVKLDSYINQSFQIVAFRIQGVDTLQDALNNSLQMPRVSPEPGGYVRFCQLWCLLEKLLQKLLIAAVEHTLLRGIVHIQDLEQDEQTESDKDEDVHLHPLLHGHGAVVVQGGHASLVDLLLDPEYLLHLLLLHHVHDCVAVTGPGLTPH